MSQQAIGQTVRQLREQAGISQNKLAKKAGISQAGLSAIESTTKSPSVQTIRLLANALGVPVSVLIEGPADEAFVDAGEAEDLNHPDIRRLARARKSMPPDKWEKMMQIAQLSFEEYFKEGD